MILAAEDRGLDADARIARNSKREPRLQVLAPVYGNRDHFSFAGFGVDMVASIDAAERPAVGLK